MNARSLTLLVVMGVLAMSFATEPASMGPFFSQPATSIPQLVAQQEMQRRYADVMLGFAQASQWQQYAAIEARKGAVSAGDNSAADLEQEDDDVSLLELKSSAPSPFAPLLQPFLGDNAQPLNDNDNLEFKSTVAKLTALKHLQVQLYLVSSDVEKTYWVNKILTPVLPSQLMYFKIYKQYLTTTALSLAYQLHDSFTLEAYLDNFNDQYGGDKTDLSESVAELQLYSHWSSLASIKLQLFYLSIYEQSMMGQVQRMAAGNAFQSASSFLEVNEELKAEPETPFVGSGDVASLVQQRTFMTQYVSFLRLYIMYSEIGLAHTGLMAAQAKHQSLTFKYDDKADNDVDGVKLGAQASELEGKQLPMLYGQWAQLTTVKYQLEFGLLYIDSQNPQLALMTAPVRADNAIQDLNLVQTEATTTPAASN